MSDGQLAAALWEEDGDKANAFELSKQHMFDLRGPRIVRCVAGRIGVWSGSPEGLWLDRWDAVLVGPGPLILRPWGNQPAWFKWEAESPPTYRAR